MLPQKSPITQSGQRVGQVASADTASETPAAPVPMPDLAVGSEQAPALSVHGGATVETLQKSAAARLAGETTEEAVYALVRDRVPALREQLRQAESSADPWEARALATRVRDEAAAAWKGRRPGFFRLARTYDYFESAMEMLRVLEAKAQQRIDEASARIIMLASDAVRHKEEIDALFERMTRLGKQMQVPLRPTGIDKRTLSAGEAATDELARVLVPEQATLQNLDALLKAERQAYTAEVERLEALRPAVEEFLTAKERAQQAVQEIESLLGTIEYQKTLIKKDLEQARARLDRAVAEGNKVRRLTTPQAPAKLADVTESFRDLHQNLTRDEGRGKQGLLVRAQEAAERSKPAGKPKAATAPSATARGRTTLPKVVASAAPRNQAQMLEEAVKEAVKEPSWLQAAIDFTMNRLALGREDHIHLAGGSHTLIYRDRLIRGFMSVHLDTDNKTSIRENNKIRGRATSKPVDIASDGESLFEVIPN